MVVAIVGATGQGKSWLLRQFINSPVTVAAIRSGNNADEATERLIWVGPMPPTNLDTRHEQFLYCSSDQMYLLGVPYLLLDSPGSTDNRSDVNETAKSALSMASVLLMVVRRDQIRSHTVDMLAAASEGSLVVPVINSCDQVTDAVQTDTEAFMARVRRAAPRSQVTAAVFVPDFEVAGRNETIVGGDAIKAIDHALHAELSERNALSRTAHRLAAMDSRFRTALDVCLRDQLPNLTAAVQRLNEAAKALPEEIAASLVGTSPALKAAIRSRLRASLLTETSSLWFPYRTVLGVLSLTSGAWDRVVLSLAGSLPSLLSAAYTGVRNFNQASEHARDVRDGIRVRSAAAVADRLGPLVARFRAEIHRLSGKQTADNDDEHQRNANQDRTRSSPAFLAGVDALQEKSQQIFDDAIERAAVSRFTATACAILGTAIFWALMAGPVVTLYRDYVLASAEALSSSNGNLERFPRPDFAMIFTSVVLSVLPLAILAMIVLSIVQGRRRVDRAEASIRDEHRQAIAHLQQQRILRLQWDDPLLADAEFLLSVGAKHSGDAEPGR